MQTALQEVELLGWELPAQCINISLNALPQ
jgi:hypothetical protein